MQSIYGFREAKVGLFVAAQRDRRLGSVALEALTLSRNFRSRPALVAWVNRVFAQVLPAQDDAARGAVAFKAAAAMRDDGAAPAVVLDMHGDMQQEARAVVAHIESALNSGMETVAVLVRKRLDLEEILPALRASGIDFKAVGLDRLSERPALLDLMSLTHALLQPSDRLAWLSTLRAPWCGLALPDLFAVAQCGRAMPDLLHQRERRRRRRRDFARRSRPARAIRTCRRARADSAVDAYRCRRWSAERGLRSGGPACAAEPIDLAVADRFFGLLAAHAKGGDVPDWHALSDALAALARRTRRQRNGARPGHDAASRQGARIRRRHHARTGTSAQRQGRTAAALARTRFGVAARAAERAHSPEPTRASCTPICARSPADEGAAELGRLLYVGCTRARERLHSHRAVGIDDHAPEGPRWKRPARGTSLAALWPAVAHEVPPPAAAGGDHPDIDGGEGRPVAATGLGLAPAFAAARDRPA